LEIPVLPDLFHCTWESSKVKGGENRKREGERKQLERKYKRLIKRPGERSGKMAREEIREKGR
jgi:hypothetical protein